jgi:23S rRNA (cytosine1962-C5)-methyltransferase
MVVWRLKKNAEKRFLGGHPWIFSNELESSPKGLPPGSAVRLENMRGDFMAWGYGNPHSLIAFRALSRNPIEQSHESRLQDHFRAQILRAWDYRERLGFRESFRLVFGEGDDLPGLIIDRYHIEIGADDIRQVLVVQMATAGIQQMLPAPLAVLQAVVEEAHARRLCSQNWEKTAVVLRNDVNVRKLEGLIVEEPNILKTWPDVDLQNCNIRIGSLATGGERLLFQTDLFEGQKTGFFLDQRRNLEITVQLVEKLWAEKLRTDKSRLPTDDAEIQILDLCTHLGQWSAHLAQTLIGLGRKVRVVAVDASEAALKLCEKNVARTGATIETRKMDVLQHLGQLPPRSFHIVIADPPAFIKSKKDIPTGQHAYLKLNTESLKLVRPEGLFVSCSCSGLLEAGAFVDIQKKAAVRAGRRLRTLSGGGHSPDHPTWLDFPEGNYLKMWAHFVVDRG